MADERTRAGLERAAAALQTGDVQGALREAQAQTGEIGGDRELAIAWLELARAAPGAELMSVVALILEYHPLDAAIVTRGCDALIRAAERLPPDEPQPAEGPAQLAAEAAARCLAAVEARADQRELVAYLHTSRANALRLLHAYDEALLAYRAALAEQPERGAFWFNLGLLHKARGAFGEALEVYRRARELLGDEKPVLWNIAISATALGRGSEAAEALRKLGHDARVAESGMPYVDGLPPLQVRAASTGPGIGPSSALPDRSIGLELLWVAPISPCHGVIASASQREAAVDFGDVVLWDAVAVGVGELAGKPVPRFPLLAILRRGDERRFRFVALQQQPGELAAFGERLPGGARLFIHHERVESLCARCAAGEQMHKHRHEPPVEHRIVYGKLVLPGALDLQRFRGELEGALRSQPQIQLVIPALLEAIGDTAAAGRAHQMWRGLERTGLKLQPR